jgi:CheY-like chemotaxis protein
MEPEVKHIAPDQAPSIVVVEDEALICDLVSDYLTDQGFEVHSFGDAEAALQWLRSGSRVDALFTDINLPGMDGAELARAARKERPALPVLYASARWNPMQQFDAVPQSVFLAKPYRPDHMVRTLRSLVGVGSAVAAGA